MKHTSRVLPIWNVATKQALLLKVKRGKVVPAICVGVMKSGRGVKIKDAIRVMVVVDGGITVRQKMLQGITDVHGSNRELIEEFSEGLLDEREFQGKLRDNANAMLAILSVQGLGAGA